MPRATLDAYTIARKINLLEGWQSLAGEGSPIYIEADRKLTRLRKQLAKLEKEGEPNGGSN